MVTIIYVTGDGYFVYFQYFSQRKAIFTIFWGCHHYLLGENDIPMYATGKNILLLNYLFFILHF